MVEEQHVIDGNLSSAQPSLTEENMQLYLANLQENSTYFFALKVWDDADRVSDTSNIVPVVFFPIDRVQPSDETTDDTLVMTLIICVIALGCVFFLVALIAVGIVVFRRLIPLAADKGV